MTLDTLANGLCPLGHDAHLRWVGFSEEGQLTMVSDNGIVSALSMKNNKWTPIMDLAQRHPDSFNQIWVVGFQEQEMFCIDLPRGIE
jgi:hypothetical protein